jgi:hypothetical protein
VPHKLPKQTKLKLEEEVVIAQKKVDVTHTFYDLTLPCVDKRNRVPSPGIFLYISNCSTSN